MNFISLPGKNHNELLSIHPFSDIYRWFTEYSCRYIGFDRSCKYTTNESCIRNIRSSSAAIVSEMLKRFGAALFRDAFYNHKLWSLSTILLAAIGPHIVYRFRSILCKASLFRVHINHSPTLQLSSYPNLWIQPSHSQTGCWNPTDSPILKSYLLGC